MIDRHNIWVNSITWSEGWEAIKQLQGGNQGEAFQARRISDGQRGFLKAIKPGASRERRARFSREANAYDTLDHIEGIPHLIESNATQHKNPKFEPYIVTEFIDGPTLREWREGRSRSDFLQAVAATRSLLYTLRDCHSEGVVHRDVKPDNIILVNADPARIKLLDFGLNYHETEAIDFISQPRQELGNRFLRLPELNAGSPHQRDPRSDLSFAAGILFYIITGKNPDQLQDAEGRLPHQRSQEAANLQNVGGARHMRLASFFDDAFALQLSNRFTSADAMLASMAKMMDGHDLSSSPQDHVEAILDTLDTKAERQRVETADKLLQALERVLQVHNEVQSKLAGRLQLADGGYSLIRESATRRLIWKKPNSNDPVMSTSCEASVKGVEIIVRLSGETIFRLPVSSPCYGDEFQQAVQDWVLKRIRKAVSDPEAMPPEAEHFAEVDPYPNLKDAAASCGPKRNILAFVYDPAQKERGRLDHCLGYFLENRRTRETLNAVFVVALVPVSQVSAISDFLNGQSMESSRWVVFNAKLEPLEHDVIYANPQEAERIALELAAKYGAL